MLRVQNSSNLLFRSQNERYRSLFVCWDQQYHAERHWCRRYRLRSNRMSGRGRGGGPGCGRGRGGTSIKCQVAALTAQLANETIDREKQLCGAMESVYKPLQDAFENISLQKYDNGQSVHGSATQHWMALDHRRSSLDSQMTHSVHVALSDAKRQELGGFQESLWDVESNWRDETTATDKGEIAQSRHLESLAGSRLYGSMRNGPCEQPFSRRNPKICKSMLWNSSPIFFNKSNKYAPN